MAVGILFFRLFPSLLEKNTYLREVFDVFINISVINEAKWVLHLDSLAIFIFQNVI